MSNAIDTVTNDCNIPLTVCINGIPINTQSSMCGSSCQAE